MSDFEEAMAGYDRIINDKALQQELLDAGLLVAADGFEVYDAPDGHKAVRVLDHPAPPPAQADALRLALERLRDRGFSFYQVPDPCDDRAGRNELDATDFADDLAQELAATALQEQAGPDLHEGPHGDCTIELPHTHHSAVTITYREAPSLVLADDAAEQAAEPGLDDAIYALHFRSHAEYCSNTQEDYEAHLQGKAKCWDEADPILRPFIERAVAKSTERDADG